VNRQTRKSPDPLGQYGILPIRIETGRYRGEAKDDRLCYFCSSDEIEDECHFLSNCTQYSNLRSELYTSIGCNPTLSMSSLECIDFLLYNYPRQTSKYLYSAYMYRDSLCYIVNAMCNICTYLGLYLI
jgi:hypothetical protein